MKIFITGITGLIGKQLAISLIKKGHQVYGVSRKSDIPFLPKNHIIKADLEKEISSDLVSGYDVIIHLSGHPVATEKWTQEVKNKIKKSRVLATENLIKAINKLPPDQRPQYFISGSAIGIYGKGFLSEVTQDWELAAKKIKNIPSARIRTGIVLSQYGGVLSEMPPVVVGQGKMMMSWIHINDWISACEYLIENRIEGEFNFTAPVPVSQSQFIKALVQSRKYPFKLWCPQFILNIVLGERASVLFESLEILPNQLVKSGYKFQFESIEKALEEIFKNQDWLSQVIFSAQHVNETKDSVFSFFSEAKNLEKITPDFLNFHILNKSTENIKKGTLIDYSLKLHGIKIKWKTLISQWTPKQVFVDEQLRGPYKKWHHTHEFFDAKQGTLMIDRVIFKIPLGVLGIVTLPWVKKDVHTIFEYRKKIIGEIFNK